MSAIEINPINTTGQNPQPVNALDFLSNYYCNYGWMAGELSQGSGIFSPGSSPTPPPNTAGQIENIEEISSRQVRDTEATSSIPILDTPTTSPISYVFLGVGVVIGIAAAVLIVKEILKAKA